MPPTDSQGQGRGRPREGPQRGDGCQACEDQGCPREETGAYHAEEECSRCGGGGDKGIDYHTLQNAQMVKVACLGWRGYHWRTMHRADGLDVIACTSVYAMSTTIISFSFHECYHDFSGCHMMVAFVLCKSCVRNSGHAAFWSLIILVASNGIDSPSVQLTTVRN